MAQVSTTATGGRFGVTSRRDPWWVQPVAVFVGLGVFGAYATWAAFQGVHYHFGPYLSPFYSPELFGESVHSWFGPKPGGWPGWMPWSPAFLNELVKQTVLRYLAVAHFGRGRGGYEDTPLSPRWAELVAAASAEHAGHLAAAWSLTARPEADGRAAAERQLVAALGEMTTAVLARGYPDAAMWLEAPDGAFARVLP